MIRCFFSRPFRLKLFGAFFLAASIPLLICSILLLQVFRIRLEKEISQHNQEYLDHMNDLLLSEETALSRCAAKISSSRQIQLALEGQPERPTDVNRVLFDAVQNMPVEAGYGLYTAEGICMFSTRDSADRDELETSWGILGKAAISDALVYCAAENPANTASPIYQAACRIQDEDGRTAGYFVASISHSDFRQALEGKYSSRSTLLLLNEYYRPVYCVQPSLAVSLVPLLRAGILRGGTMESIEEDFTYVVSPAPHFGLIAVLRSPVIFTKDTLHLLQTVTLLVLLLSLLVSALLAIRFSGQIYEPFDRLYSAFQQVSGDNFDVYVDPVRNDELGELTVRFNQMTSDLKKNREELLRNERELNEAQIRMLQAQLNPHFLSNTLDTMKWISKINQVPQLATMSVDLADILRFGISPAEFVSLEDELNVLDRYIEIQKIRLSGRFTFTLQVPDGLRSCFIPKMILQPLVENSILHGISDMEEGIITLKITGEPESNPSSAGAGFSAVAEKHGVVYRTEDPILTISVLDNGKGFPPDMTGQYRKPDDAAGHHLGLYNVDTILKKHYGSQFGLFLDNDTDEDGKILGAVITARLPLSYERPGHAAESV